jgi:poly(hydroxyalkanoate) granule-associated protein
MVKKLKQLAGSNGDGQFVTAIKDSANQIWLAGLGAFAKAQEGFSKTQEGGAQFFEALVREGEKVQRRATKAAGDTIADVKDQATGTWGKLERVFEDRVGQALHRLNVPTKRDVDTLSKRVSELTAATKKLSASKGAGSARRASKHAA